MPFNTGASQTGASQTRATSQAPSRADITIDKGMKSPFVLGLGVTSLGVVVLVHWVPELAITLPILGLSAFGYWLWQQWQQEAQQKQKRQGQIDAKFYQLLQQRQGRISLLDFAMRAKLNGGAAQDYLNRQADAFSGYVETGLAGNIIYVFNLLAMQGDTRHRANPAEAAWAYAEQTREKKIQTDKKYAAWVNAKQIRTLQQLSQTGGNLSISEVTPPRAQLSAPPKINPTGTPAKHAHNNASASAVETPKTVQAGYIAISTSATADSEGGNNGRQAKPTAPQKIQTHRAIKLPGGRHQPHSTSDRVITIDVPAIGE